MFYKSSSQTCPLQQARVCLEYLEEDRALMLKPDKAQSKAQPVMQITAFPYCRYVFQPQFYAKKSDNKPARIFTERCF